MPRSTRECGPTPPALDFDPHHILERDPFVLLDPRLLAPLLTQFAEELGPERAGVAVTQIGTVLGLRDALVALQGLRGLRANGPDPLATPLRMRCQPAHGKVGDFEIRGHWPDRSEAAARLAAVGSSPSGGCQLSLGYTTGWLSVLYEQELYAVEDACRVDGHATCGFVARSGDRWRERGPSVQLERLDALRLPELQRYVQGLLRDTGRRGSARYEGVERDTCAIHIWGPVMVIPYSGPDEALAALELIGRDPSAEQVSVVVLDLEGAIVDEAHGALALEHIVHHIEAWGAEAIFTEPSLLSAKVLPDLEHAPLLVVKDLDAAIATAFQVAESQRQRL